MVYNKNFLHFFGYSTILHNRGTVLLLSCCDNERTVPVYVPWKDALLRSAASDMIGSRSKTWAAVSDSYLGSVASAALSAKHSRYHETQADDYGYDFLKKSGKNPWALGLAFKKMKALSKQGNKKYQKLLEAFSSHPDFDERINRVKEKAKKDGYNCN